MTDSTVVKHGIYRCRICAKEYVVNKPDSWDLCTPTICHECFAWFREQERGPTYGEYSK